MSAQQFRKKPVVIEAVQWDGNNYAELREFVGESLDAQWSVGGYCFINTLEGRMNAYVGDWIIRGVKGEFYPCKPDIFAATYDPVSTTGDVSSPPSSESSASEASRLTERDAEREKILSKLNKATERRLTLDERSFAREALDRLGAALVARDAELAKFHEDAAFTAGEVERVANAAIDAWQLRAEALGAEVTQLRAALEAASKYLAELHHRGIVNEPLRCHVDGLLAGVVPPEQAPQQTTSGDDRSAVAGSGGES